MTAEEIFEEVYGSSMANLGGALKLALKEISCTIARKYANQKLDEAKMLMPEFDYVNKNLLDSLKDKV